MSKLNLIGQKYNKLTVISCAQNIKNRTAWNCQCDCGNIKIIKTEELRSGGTKSCGCWNDKQRSTRSKKMYSRVTKYTPEEATARRIWSGNYRDMLFEDFYEISKQNCFYCGLPPSNFQNASGKNSSENMKINGNFIYSGLDRVDNSKPHSRENCVPCCKYCNYSKRERSFEDFKKWVFDLYNNLNKII